MPNPHPYLIAIEGIDGTGKSTLAEALGRALEQKGRSVRLSFEPTRGQYGRMIRELAVTGRVSPAEESELFIADRKEHVEQLIRPALAAGQTVILDRYYFSTMAYQGARGLDPDEIRRANEAFAPSPDLLVILELPVSEALNRITNKRGSIPDHFEGADYLAEVDRLFKSFTHPNILRLDARAPTACLVESIIAKIQQA